MQALNKKRKSSSPKFPEKGENLTKNELQRRLMSMGISLDNDEHPKSYYQKIYDDINKTESKLTRNNVSFAPDEDINPNKTNSSIPSFNKRTKKAVEEKEQNQSESDEDIDEEINRRRKRMKMDQNTSGGNLQRKKSKSKDTKSSKNHSSKPKSNNSLTSNDYLNPPQQRVLGINKSTSSSNIIYAKLVDTPPKFQEMNPNSASLIGEEIKINEEKADDTYVLKSKRNKINNGKNNQFIEGNIIQPIIPNSDNANHNYHNEFDEEKKRERDNQIAMRIQRINRKDQNYYNNFVNVIGGAAMNMQQPKGDVSLYPKKTPLNISEFDENKILPSFDPFGNLDDKKDDQPKIEEEPKNQLDFTNFEKFNFDKKNSPKNQGNNPTGGYYDLSKFYKDGEKKIFNSTKRTLR